MALNIVKQIDDYVKVSRVLISVWDKTGLDKLVHGLLRVNPDLKIFSTGGTYHAIAETLGESAAKSLSQVSDYTGQPEMQGGLVKTLDFKIYLGLLSETYNKEHVADLERTDSVKMDMVVVNLYPFGRASSAKDATLEHARANIDIGGPCMARAAAKNFLRVASVTSPSDYDAIVSELEKSGGAISLRTRFELAVKAFAHTAAYDAAIARYLEKCDFEKARTCYMIMGR